MGAKLNFNHERTRELFQVLAYSPDDKFFFLADQCLAFGFVCDPLSHIEASISDRLNVFLNMDWPADTLIQFHLWSSPDIEEPLANMRELRMNHPRKIYRDLANEKAKFLKKGTEQAIEKNSATRVRDNHIIITVKIPLKGAEPTDKEVLYVKDMIASSGQAIQTCGMHPKTLTNDLYVRLMQTMLNWKKDSAWRDTNRLNSDPNVLLSDQLLDWGESIEVHKDGLTVSGKHVKVLSIKRYPEDIYFGEAINYLGDCLTGSRGIRQNVMITTTIHYPEAEKMRPKLEAQKQWITNQALGPIVRFVPIIESRRQNFEVLMDALEDGDRPIRVYTGISLFTDTKEESSQAVSNLRTYFREIGFQIMEDNFFCLPFFLNNLPLGGDKTCIREFARYRTMGTRHVLPILPIFSDWKGTGTPYLNFISRNGQLMDVSLFDSGSNYNCCIAAQSGSGKSFLTNEIIKSYLSGGGRVWVIDVGRSYEKLCDVLDGDYIEFTREKQICLNPFQLIESWEEEADIISGLVIAMAAPNQELSDFQIISLKQILKALWDEKGKSLLVDDIAMRTKQHVDPRVRDVGHQLFQFTSDGEYGRFFNGNNNVRFDNDFSVLELEELKGRKHLQQVVLLQLIYQVQQDMYLGVKDRPKIVIIDEAWDLLTHGAVAKFIEHGYRRFRKYYGAAITITQSVNDLYGNATGRAIVENSANMYLLGQKDATVDMMLKEGRLPIGEGGAKLLKTVRTVPGSFSEIYFLTEMGAGIGRLIVPPFDQLLYSTKPDEVNEIKKLTAVGYSVPEAINYIIHSRDCEKARINGSPMPEPFPPPSDPKANKTSDVLDADDDEGVSLIKVQPISLKKENDAIDLSKDDWVNLNKDNPVNLSKGGSINPSNNL